MQALDLFSNIGEPVDEWSGSLREIIFHEASRAPGLAYVPEFITLEEEGRLIDLIDTMPWSHEYSRRRQHYGYAYHPGGEEKVQALPLPEWLRELAERMAGEGKIQNEECKRQSADFKSEIGNRKSEIEPAAASIFTRPPEMALINEYLPGQGISPHVDLGDQNNIVVSLSLGSTCIMEFTPVESGKEIVSVLLERRSLVVIRSNARTAWKHGISKRRTDRFHGQVFERGRRVSITFRGM